MTNIYVQERQVLVQDFVCARAEYETRRIEDSCEIFGNVAKEASNIVFMKWRAFEPVLNK